MNMLSLDIYLDAYIYIYIQLICNLKLINIICNLYTVRNFYRDLPKHVTGVIFSYSFVKLGQNLRKFSYFLVNLRGFDNFDIFVFEFRPSK